MSTRYPTCSKASSERSNPQAEASPREPVSRNASELDSASLRLLGVTNLPDMPKSATDEEAIPVSIRQAPRGDWRQRTGKEKSRNLRGPRSAKTLWESDAFIVVGKGLIRLERREATVRVQPLKSSRVLDRMIPYTHRKGASGKWTLNAELVTVQKNLAGKPDAGNLHVRFDEGECRDWLLSAALHSLLYWFKK